MEILFNICVAASIGVIIGALVGALKMLVSKQEYTEKQLEQTEALKKRAASLAKVLTFFALGIGLIWCIYYLVLGAVDSSQVDYATGMSQLIVSILTIISIMFAFFEFLRRT